jgi:hypothetical protein
MKRIAFVSELVVGSRRELIAAGNQALSVAVARGVTEVAITKDDELVFGENLLEWGIKPSPAQPAEVYRLAREGEYVLTIGGRWNAWYLLG